MVTKYIFGMTEMVDQGRAYSPPRVEGEVFLKVRRDDESFEYTSNSFNLGEGCYLPDEYCVIPNSGRAKLPGEKEILEHVSRVLVLARRKEHTFDPSKDSISFERDGKLVACGEGFNWGASATRSLESLAEPITRELRLMLPRTN